MKTSPDKPRIFRPFKITQEELEHLDALHRLVAEALIKMGEAELVPPGKVT